MTLAILFNGQGAQYEGMGLDFDRQFTVARDVFDLFEAETDYPIRQWIEGDIDQLQETRHSQPAIAAVSLAMFYTLQDQYPQLIHPAYMAGLSLGEYTSLIASGMLSLADGAQLLKERGELMSNQSQQIAAHHAVQMAAVMGMPLDEIKDLVDTIHTEETPLYIANLNSTQQTIIAGYQEAIKSFRKQAKAQGYKKVIPLKVEGPFHSPLMQAVCDPLADALADITFTKGEIPVISNTTVEIHQPEQVRELLVRHLVEPVRFQETVSRLVEEGVTHVIQIGPGATLANLLKREEHAPTCYVVDTVEDLVDVPTFLADCQINKE